jgi:hypothetical protein
MRFRRALLHGRRRIAARLRRRAPDLAQHNRENGN